MLSVVELLASRQSPTPSQLTDGDEKGILEYPYAGEEDEGDAVVLIDEVQWYDEPSPVDDFDEEMLNGTQDI